MWKIHWLINYSNEGKDYSFSIFYYRGKDKTSSKENEIDLVIEENGVVYPIEIKMSGNPKASMASANTVLDKIPDKKRGTGIILCLIDKKTYIRENLIALPIEYLWKMNKWRICWMAYTSLVFIWCL